MSLFRSDEQRSNGCRRLKSSIYLLTTKPLHGRSSPVFNVVRRLADERGPVAACQLRKRSARGGRPSAHASRVGRCIPLAVGVRSVRAVGRRLRRRTHTSNSTLNSSMSPPTGFGGKTLRRSVSHHVPAVRAPYIFYRGLSCDKDDDDEAELSG